MQEQKDEATVLFHIPKPSEAGQIPYLTIAKFSDGVGSRVEKTRLEEFSRRLAIEFGDRFQICSATNSRNMFVRVQYVKPLRDGDVACESGALARLIETHLGIRVAVLRECSREEIRTPPL